MAGVGAGLGATALGLWRPRHAHADWADLPPAVGTGLRPARRVLEIFLYGGLSPWETFYHRPAPGPGFGGFDVGPNPIGSLRWNPACPGAPSGAEIRELGRDSAGHTVYLGPFVKPIWHLRSRMRVVCLGHGLPPHELAIPLALGGHRLGRPNLAGMGAAMQRRYAAESELVPRAFVCTPQSFNFPNDNIDAATSSGLHGGAFRPVLLRVGPASAQLAGMLERSGRRSQADDLLKAYRGQYRDELRWRGGAVTRSRGFRDYDFSSNLMFRSRELRNVLATSPITPLQSSAACALEDPAPAPFPGASSSVPRTALDLARYLLTHPASPARYVCVIDAGLHEVPSGGGYDTHSSNHLENTATNLWNTLSALAAVVRDPAAPPPGPTDPPKIDLDDTMIILTTEFGRTPFRSSGDAPSPTSGGRDHWTSGYTSVLIGGPVVAGVSGTIDGGGRAASVRADGTTGAPYTPTDLRAAALVAAGIDPFDPEAANFAVGDVGDAVRRGTEDDTALALRRQVLEGARS
jgi:hypothetical protein